MANATETMNLLLIEENSSKGALLRQALEANNVNCSFRSIAEGKSTLAYLKRVGPYKEAPVPDIILFDFSEPDETSLALLKSLALGPKAVNTPLVLLTSRPAEDLLDDASEDRDSSSFFAPVELASFLQRIRELRKDRLLSALSLMSNLGLILVRLPAYILQQRHQERRALSA